MRLTPDLLLQAYAAGIFPMADSADSDEIDWYDPPLRGIIPLDDGLHVPRRLARKIRQRPFDIRFDTAFETVVRACAAPAPDRPKTWINEKIIRLYTELFRKGHARSVEAWEKDELVGGLYGVLLGKAFFGESMFSRRTDASKIALVHLIEHLREKGFLLLDAQFLTDHLAQFGAMEITREAYKERLEKALS